LNSEAYALALSVAKREIGLLRPFLKGEFDVGMNQAVRVTPGMMAGVDLATSICLLRSPLVAHTHRPAKDVISKLHRLVAASLKYPSAFDELSYAAKVCLEQNVRLPIILRQWVGEVLTGSVPRPTTPREDRRAKTYPKLYDKFLARIVLKIHRDFSVPIISKNSPNWSACEVVAKALLDLRLKPTSELEVFKLMARTGMSSMEKRISLEALRLPNEVNDPFSS
jgi:hypothetical protein